MDNLNQKQHTMKLILISTVWYFEKFVRNPNKLPERNADIIPLMDDYYQIIE